MRKNDIWIEPERLVFLEKMMEHIRNDVAQLKNDQENLFRSKGTTKSFNYADHTPELSVHVYGFSSAAVRDELAEEIKETLRRFHRNHPDEVLQRKITLD